MTNLESALPVIRKRSKKTVKAPSESCKLFQETVAKTHGLTNASIRTPIFSNFAETLLPGHHITRLKARFPSCVDIGRWANSDNHTHQMSMVITFTYRSPDRCVMRKAIICVAYNGKARIDLITGKEIESFPCPDTPAEITERLLQLLEGLMPT